MTHPDPERIWLEPCVEGAPADDRSWADSDVWSAELDDPTLVPTEYVRADLVRALVGQLTRLAAVPTCVGRVAALIRAVQAIDGFEMTEDEAAAVLATLDAAELVAP